MSLHGIAAAGSELLRVLAPSACVVCGSPLGWGASRVASCCRPCWDSLPTMSTARCSRCALIWEGHAPSEDFTCMDCQTLSSDLEWIESWGPYRGGTVDLVGALKFSKHDFLARALSGLMVEALRRRSLDFDAVIPVPMHPAKRRRRGYNQAALLARAVAERTGIAFKRGWLSKILDTRPQSSLNRTERGANLRGAYRASPAARGAAILLVDDICTTGATLEACATALAKQGAGRVCAVTLARA